MLEHRPYDRRTTVDGLWAYQSAICCEVAFGPSYVRMLRSAAAIACNRCFANACSASMLAPTSSSMSTLNFAMPRSLVAGADAGQKASRLRRS